LELLKVDSLDSEGSYTDPSSSASDSDAFNQSETTYKGIFSFTFLLLDPYFILFPFPIQDQLLKARTSIVRRVRSVGKSSKSPKHLRSQSQSQSPHPPPLATLPPVSPPPPTTTLSPSALSSKPLSPFDFSSQPLSSATRPRNLHHPSSSSSDSDAFNQSEATSYSPFDFSPSRPPSAAPTPTLPTTTTTTRPRMSPALLSLLVYTVGVKFRGLNKKEEYAPCHMFSLSENVANKMITTTNSNNKFGVGGGGGIMGEMIKHTRTHLVRTYPKGTRLSSTNYEPHRFWAGGMQLVAINWQTFGK
jgi:phosphatidylinositol phospholipase C, delta